MQIKETTTLYYTQGNSDKVYHAQLNEGDGGYTVTFAFGRRGSALKDGSKTATPVPYETAKKVYDKLVHEKTAKGYTPGQDGSPFQGTSSKEHSGVFCQLLNAVDDSEAARLCLDPMYVLQEKHDGERRLIEYRAGEVRGINRKGQYLVVPEPLVISSQVIGHTFLLDGEVVGDVLHVFDLLEDQTGSLLTRPYVDRLKHLSDLLAGGGQDNIILVEAAYTAAEKLALLERVRARNGEGVVFKRLDAEYTAGRPDTGGPALKYKLYDTCSVVVAEISEGRRSVGMTVLSNQDSQNDEVVDIGRVTIPANFPMPEIGDVIEVRYLYAYRNGSLFQPVYLGKRSDVLPAECRVGQLKYKPTTETSCEKDALT